MGRTHLVVDGSNIATEGRTAPSLAQLDEAVGAFTEDRDYKQVVVVVDASFGRRIDESEHDAFEAAVTANRVISPPAGTIGRGDVFILEVARRADADVLSNDSFQELHAEHPWLFEGGRLWGGKPVPAVGWVFVARAPVRGVVSRKVTQAATKAKKAAEAAVPQSAEKPSAKKAARKVEPAAAKKVAKQAPATKEPKERGDKGRGDKGRGEKGRGDKGRGDKGPKGRSDKSRPHSNDQLPYATFVINHPVGSIVEGVVDRFSSHGAYVRFGTALGYVPLRSLGDPPPRSAREVLAVGDARSFRVMRFDPSTRGIDVVPDDLGAPPTSVAPRRGRQAAAASAAAGSTTPDAEEAPVSPAAKKATAKKAPAKKAAAKKTTAKKAVAKKAPAKKAPAKKAVAKKAPARKATAKKAPARKAAAKKAPAKKATAKKAPARKAVAKKAPARKAAAKKTTAKKAVAKKR
jgi:hypothetical protein